MGEIIAIVSLSAVILYFGIINYRDREFFYKTISDMHNKLLAKSLPEYASVKSKIDQKPDAPISSEERLAQVQLLKDSGDVFAVGA